MNVSIFFAKALGLYLTIASLAIMINVQDSRLAITEMFNQRAVLFLTAIVTLILGIIMILFHNIWVADWRVIITVLCWLTFIKGIVRIYAPNIVRQWRGVFQSKISFLIIGFISLALGLYLLYMGFEV